MTLKNMVRRWSGFFIGLLLIWSFIFIFAPLVQNVSAVNELHCLIRARDIDAGSLFYTDTEEFGDADVQIRNSMSYSP